MDQLLKTIESIITVSESDRLIIAKLFHIKHFKKGEYLVRAGDTCGHIFFIEGGLVRYYVDKDGTQQTHYFNKSGEFVCDYLSFLPQVPSFVNIQALEDTVVSQVSAEGIKQFYSEVREGEKFGRVAVEQVFTAVLSQIISLYNDSPDKRYLNFLADYPDLLKCIPQYYIASYVGVKPPSLSRIRKRLANKL
jgi:CRP-like cAMP-binding protein